MNGSVMNRSIANQINAETLLKTHLLLKANVFRILSAFVKRICEFEKRSSHFLFLLLARKIYAHASEHSRSRGCPLIR